MAPRWGRREGRRGWTGMAGAGLRPRAVARRSTLCLLSLSLSTGAVNWCGPAGPGYSRHKLKMRRSQGKETARSKRKPPPAIHTAESADKAPHSGAAREEGRGFLRRATVKPWGGPQGQRVCNRGRNKNEGSNWRQFRRAEVVLSCQFIVGPKIVSYVWKGQEDGISLFYKNPAI